MSGEANNLNIDLKAALDRDFLGDVGVPASADLLGFTNTVELQDGDIDQAHGDLITAIGSEGAREAAAIIAIFNGLVRVADGTGIQLDDGVFAASVEERDSLGIDDFSGASSSADKVIKEGAAPSAVDQLFG